jgi:hypothetical protein
VTRMFFSASSNSAISRHVLRRWRSSRMNSKCGSKMLRNGFPPPFRCAFSVIAGQDNPIVKHLCREQVKVKVRSNYAAQATRSDNFERQKATLFDERRRQMATSSLSLLVALIRTTFALNDFVRRWCHQKVPAFTFLKAARNHVRLNVSKLDDDGCRENPFLKSECV